MQLLRPPESQDQTVLFREDGLLLLEVKEAGQTVLDVGGCQVVDGSSRTSQTQASVQSTVQSAQSSIAISHPGVGAVTDNGIVAAIVVLADRVEPGLAQVAGDVCAAEQSANAFIALASDDEAVSPENSVLYYLALLKNKVSASLHIYPKGGHSFGFRDNFVYKRQWTDELEKWLSTIE